ncbi:MAG: SLC13 family permease, partial [Planctomycetaceae bacterium]|nr:SLC13 family permease [Planctomycetaceae bacterium]
CRVLGEKRFPVALCGSGFVLSIPVFYDTVFFLLIPLARSFYRRVRKNYILCLMAICAGAMITHTMVPPTPGPLAIAGNLGIDLGQMMLIGLFVGVLIFPFGLAGSYLIDWYMPNPKIHFPANETGDDPENPSTGEQQQLEQREKQLPSLGWAMLPVTLPVLLIACASFVNMLSRPAGPDAVLPVWLTLLKTVGGKEIAMMLAAATAMFVCVRQKIASADEMRKDIETALLDAGLIILITAAGGAFGTMLKEAGIGGTIEAMFQSESGVAGVSVLVAAFCVASVLKLSLGSSTTAMLTASSIIGAMGLTSETLGFNLAYLGLVIASGSLVTSWMNDSGFWLTSRMGGLSETDTLKSVTVLHIIVGCSGFVIILILSQLLPLTNFGK